MPNQIPQDFDGESWTCYQIAWPQSAEFEQMLRDMLYMLTRGRWWDETTGRVTDMQAIAWEMFRRNLPLSGCGQDDDNDECIPQSEYDRLLAELEERYTSGAGALIEGDDDMGQVVTDVTCENGKLYVWFGPCCKKKIGCIMDFEQEPEQYEWTPPEGFYTEPPAFSWSCRKAHAIVEGLNSMLNNAADLIENEPQGTIVKEWNDRLPWVQRGPFTTYRFLAEAYIVSTLLTWPEWTEQEKQTYRCQLSATLSPGLALTDEDYEVVKALFRTNDILSSDELTEGFVQFPKREGFDRLIKSTDYSVEPNCCVDANAWPNLDSPADGGWYFGEEQEITITSTGSSGWTPTDYDFGEQSHDVVGYVITQFSRSAGQLKRMGSVGTSIFNDSNDMGAYGVNYFNAAGGASPTLDEWFQSRGVGYKFSSTGRSYGTIAAPNLDAPVTPVATFNLGWNVSAEATIKIRLVFNTNSPSHSA